MSPERISPQQFGVKNSRPTVASDCYALGMVIYEIISGNLPFHKDADLEVFMKVVRGERPPRGVRFTESLWKMLELCWKPQPNDRPSIEDILQCLEVVSTLPEPASPGVGEEMDEDSDDWDSTTGSSGILNWTSSMKTTNQSTAMPSSSNDLTDRPPGPISTTPEPPIFEVIDEVDVDDLHRGATDMAPSFPPVDSNDGGTYQVGTIYSHSPVIPCKTYCTGHRFRSNRGDWETWFQYTDSGTPPILKRPRFCTLPLLHPTPPRYDKRFPLAPVPSEPGHSTSRRK